VPAHPFYSVYRPSNNEATANDDWERVLPFYGKHLDA
jgi:hypothetical protein